MIHGQRSSSRYVERACVPPGPPSPPLYHLPTRTALSHPVTTSHEPCLTFRTSWFMHISRIFSPACFIHHFLPTTSSARSRENGAGARIATPSPCVCGRARLRASTCAQVYRAFYRTVFNGLGLIPGILLEMYAEPGPTWTGYVEKKNARRVWLDELGVGMGGRRRCRGSRVFVSRVRLWESCEIVQCSENSGTPK